MRDPLQFIRAYNATREDGAAKIRLQVDKAASSRVTSFFRPPYTINQKFKTRTTFERRTDRRYTADELVEYIDDNRRPESSTNTLLPLMNRLIIVRYRQKESILSKESQKSLTLTKQADVR